MIGRIIRTVLGGLAGLALGLVVLSFGWVVLYRFVPPPITWLQARDAINGQHVEREWVPLTAMTKALPRAVIGAEDANFCRHSGFDLDAIQAAASANSSGKTLRGGSTISQQTAKNAFLWPERSYVRKGLEAYFTLLIELVWGKPRIMEVYLNIVEMGQGIYGMEAAAEHYFDTTADKLSARQAARLAAILPQPIKRSAVKPSRSVKRYARRIEKRVKLVRDEGIDSCLWQ
ncbi:MAG: monofunctional biosynthetic peptidoglycan transglycosylase [Alphaproteobacteria bacterium]|nr:monofunctional biosynthetic peptidoglycan transglycosylase [Alphaproteobacteria bacterium]